MMDVEQAQSAILSAVALLPSASLAAAAALGRFASEPIHAIVDLPVADNSSMDGYAVRSNDLAAASPQSPVALRLIETASAGKPPAALQPGACIRIFTGSLLPQGADAVVMQEDVRAAGQEIIFTDKIAPWENTRLRGEEIKAGAMIVSQGEQITASKLGLLAAAGAVQVQVGCPPVVGIIATGSELRDPGQPLSPGMIYESNRLMLAAMASQTGAIPKIYPIVPDTLAATTAALEQAFSECDFLITSGGVSVGDFDWVKPAFERIGGRLEFWTVAMRPGKPFAFGRLRDKLLFGLPGNPVSAVVTFFILARPALLRSQGARETAPRKIAAILGEPLVNRGDRCHYIRVTAAPSGRIHSAGPQASHRLATLANSIGLVAVPPQTTLPESTPVSVLLWD